jgi:hypothetical protein
MYDSQAWIRDVVGRHSNVREVEQLAPNRFKVRRVNGNDLMLFLTPAYILSVADYEQLRAQHPDVDMIALASNWNSTTMEAKDRGIEDGVGIFDFNNLMGALNLSTQDRLVRHAYPDLDAERRRGLPERTRWP